MSPSAKAREIRDGGGQGPHCRGGMRAGQASPIPFMRQWTSRKSMHLPSRPAVRFSYPWISAARSCCWCPRMSSASPATRLFVNGSLHLRGVHAELPW